ncbi:hypothetical protein cand_027950 [Cryptosporidium andersoni]|uniref:Uncharacterized protein n=1 Tax=Cryptosporidium andersoni TaxID=117008 RepID=A0A1J4MQZ5_9CRYT|nr:hypothetical protein cand_027950 [Cryptosporidium andersoni]
MKVEVNTQNNVGGKLSIGADILNKDDNGIISNTMKYSIPLLLKLRTKLGIKSIISDDYVDLMGTLLLEERPNFIETNDTSKHFGGRFSLSGFSSRGSRNSSRSRLSHGSSSKRSIVKVEDDDIWDMPCTSSADITLGDIREAESRMKAEDLTLDQYVEKHKGFLEKKSMQNKEITNNNNSDSNNNITGPPINCLSNINAKNNTNTNVINNDANIFKQPSNFIGSFTSSNDTSIGTKSSYISETFLKGPANLSLFDVNTPLFDDDTNDNDVRLPLGSNPNNITVNTNNITNPGVFSWSNRSSSVQCNNILNTSTSFPALSKIGNVPITIKQAIDNSSIQEPNMLQRLHTSVVTKQSDVKHSFTDPRLQHGVTDLTYQQSLSSITNNNRRSSFSTNQVQNSTNLNRSSIPPSFTEYPLSSASIPPHSINQIQYNRQNTIKTNDAGRLLMSIIGAGSSHNNNSNNQNQSNHYYYQSNNGNR